MLTNKISRRQYLNHSLTALAGLLTTEFALSIPGSKNKEIMRTRVVPSSGEKIPVVGLGTWIQFDVGRNSSEITSLKEVLRLMYEKGGKMIDSSPMYGNSEDIIGYLTDQTAFADHFFYATKVWTSGREAGIRQMNNSLKKMKRRLMDLIQVHNLVDWKTHLKTLRGWKEQGKVRYTGVTHYTDSSHKKLQQVIESEEIDFVQFNYSIRERHAERFLLDSARDHGVAVIINRPYAGGNVFSKVKGEKLPSWVREFEINSWGQFFLKYILSHEAVTCAIPGTSNPGHLVDNMMAGYGPLPDDKTRQRMADYFSRL